MAGTADSDGGGAGGSALPAGNGMSRSLFRFILETTARHQAALSALTVVVFLLELVPLELQRRIVNELVDQRDYRGVALLCAAYAGLVIFHGLTKFGLNVYRNWVGESSTRRLRLKIRELTEGPDGVPLHPEQSGIEVSMVVAEVEPIGGFVGASVSEPLLQAGILVTVVGYMLHLEPWMGLATLAIFIPHTVVVPLMQRAINRRSVARVQTLREISIGIVGPVHDGIDHRPDGVGLIDRVFALNMGIFKLKFSMNFIMNLTHHLEIVGALLLGGWLVVIGHTEVGTVVAFISSIGRLNDPWGDLVNYFRDVSSVRVKYRLVTDAVEALRGTGAR